jgi:hypothetical protein
MQESSRTQKQERNMLVGQIRMVTALWLLLAAMSLPSFAQNVATGRLVGRIVGAESGEAIIGASVMLEGTKLGAAANLNGDYVINNVPAGSYRLIMSAVGRVKTIIESVMVTANQSIRIDLALEVAEIVGKQVVVEARRMQDTEASMLKQRERSTSVSDAISAQLISQTGAGDAAAAMSRVTGASVVGGKYVLIRGLGDRYVNTQLNGSLLPSTDPDKPSVQMDLIPANLLDNIVVQKTFTPDKSGDFTGGSVNMSTKDLPDRLLLNYSTSASYNTLSTFEDVLTQPGGTREWIGMDGDSRQRPSIVSGQNYMIPDYTSVQKDSAGAAYLEQTSESFNNDFSFHRRKAPLNQNHAFSFGNQYSLWDRPLGVLASLTYNRNYAYYDNGAVARWDAVIGGKELSKAYYLNDVRGTEEVLWGSLAKVTYHLNPSSVLSINYNRNQSGDKSTRWLYGELPRDLPEGATWETRVFQYTERSMSAIQLNGEHSINWFRPIRAEWRLSQTRNTQDDPDLRFFSSDYFISEDGTDTVFNISPSNYDMPAHYFRSLVEKNREGALDLTVPLGRKDSGTKLKFGMAYLDKTRDQTEYQYEMRNPSYSTIAHFDGNTDRYFGPANTGVIGWDQRGQRYLFGNVVVENIQWSSVYSGDQSILSFYAMTELALTKRVDLITGARIERTRMNVVSRDKTKPEGHLNITDILPSANLIYHLRKGMNLRGAFGITVARPTIREMAPFSNFEFVNGYRLTGNPKLNRAKVHNYDIRWEWFPAPGEVVAVSGFYKNFFDPIERFQVGINLELNYENVDEARVLGAEFELRKRLDNFHLPNFQINGNLTFVDSRVALDANELSLNRSVDPNAPDHRNFGGQSPYLINLDLTYDNAHRGTTATLAYNVFGARLSDNVLGLTPDVYEQPRNLLDFVGSQKIWGGIKASFSAKNILDAKTRKTYTYLGKEYVSSEYGIGRTYSFGLSYEL